MAARRKKRPLRPRVPARVKKRKQRRKPSHHQNELLGLGLTALGLVFSAILYLGFDGGAVGSWLAEALEAVYAEVQERGAEIDYTLYDAPSGFREFGVQDPDGHDIAFGQRL